MILKCVLLLVGGVMFTMGNNGNNPCNPNECMNGGTCVKNNDKGRCFCPSDQPNCDGCSPLKECDPSSANTCGPFGGGPPGCVCRKLFTCECVEGRAGELCEVCADGYFPCDGDTKCSKCNNPAGEICEDGADASGADTICGCPMGEVPCDDSTGTNGCGARCDGVDDCADMSDEANCGSCTGGQEPCVVDGAADICVTVCDGNVECDDGSDEDEDRCGCTSPRVPCNDWTDVNGNPRCGNKCDGTDDCYDGSDEVSCEGCEDQFECYLVGSPLCIDYNKVCDGVKDCYNNEDENNCAKVCDNNDKCKNGGSCWIEGFCTCPDADYESCRTDDDADGSGDADGADCCLKKCRAFVDGEDSVNLDRDLDCSDISNTNEACDCLNRQVCRCLPGFTGEYCEIPKDECEINPCLNGGGCVYVPGDSPNYKCNCITGYTGQNCETPLFDCCIEPCQNMGICKPIAEEDPDLPDEEKMDPEGRGYVCVCPAAYEGQNCELQKNICAKYPCKNGGTCMPAMNEDGFICKCHEDWEGTYCQTSCSTVATPTYIAPNYNAPRGYSNSYKKPTYGGKPSYYGYDADEAAEASKDSGKSVKSSSKTIKGYSGGKTRSKTGGRTGSKAPSKTASKAAFTRGIKKASSANTKAQRVKKTGRGQNFVNDYGYYGLDF